MMESRKLIIFGFVVCLAAILAYVFVFADVPFVNEPVQVDGYVAEPGTN